MTKQTPPAASPVVDDDATPALSPSEAGGASSDDVSAEGGETVLTPPESSPEAPEEIITDVDHMPAFVITCPKCMTSFPWTADIEGFEPSESSKTLKCVECDGMGVVSTGSFVTAHMTMECPDCKGMGFVAKPGEVLPEVAPTSQPPWEGATWNAELNTWT